MSEDTESSSNGNEWLGWTCDELTPNLCDLSVEEGSVLIRGIEVHYWKYSRQEPQQTEQDLFPIVAIHGGPAWPHNYLLPLKQQACHGRDIYFYDQAGCGKSLLSPNTTTVQEQYPWLLTAEYYAQEELPTLVQHWGLSEFHIIGNSWGTMVAQLYALDTQPPYLASMVLSGPLSDVQLYIKSQWDPQDGTLGSLPPFVQKRIQSLEEAHAYGSEEYGAIDDVLSSKFTCRTAPPPDCFMASAQFMNVEIYVGMQGPSEFAVSGVLADFNYTDRLPSLTRTPILLTHGKYDTMRPPVIDVMYQALPLAEVLFLTKSGHVSMIDEPETMNEAIADFFLRVEGFLASGQTFVPKEPTGRHPHPLPYPHHNNFKSSSFLLIVGTVAIAFFTGMLFGQRKQPRAVYEPL